MLTWPSAFMSLSKDTRFPTSQYATLRHTIIWSLSNILSTIIPKQIELAFIRKEIFSQMQAVYLDILSQKQHTFCNLVHHDRLISLFNKFKKVWRTVTKNIMCWKLNFRILTLIVILINPTIPVMIFN